MSRTFLFTFVLLLAIAVAAQTAPQSKPQPTPGAGTSTAPSAPAEPSADEQARQTIDNVSASLNLTDAQKAQLRPIVTQEIQLVHQLRADTTLTPEQKSTKFRETLTADHAKIDAILTPEQKQKLTEMNRQRQAEENGPSQPQNTTPAPGNTPGQTPNPSPNPNPPKL